MNTGKEIKTAEEILENISDSRYSIPMPFNWDMLYAAMDEYADAKAKLQSQNKSEKEQSLKGKIWDDSDDRVKDYEGEKEQSRYIEYLKAEYDFQLIQLDGLNISKDQSFEQRINTVIAMAWENKSEKKAANKNNKKVQELEERDFIKEYYELLEKFGVDIDYINSQWHENSGHIKKFSLLEKSPTSILSDSTIEGVTEDEKNSV